MRSLSQVPPLSYLRFVGQYLSFRKLNKVSATRFTLNLVNVKPYLNDNTAATGFDRHYVYHTAWAARIVRILMPATHVDIGSSLYFVGTVSAFIPIECYDYRPADLRLNEVKGGHADLVALPFKDHSLDSISCMHVVEHVGLGRYGDPIDPDGDMKSMAELQRVIAPAGSLLFVVPVGRPRVCFNAHRIYSYEMIREAFSELELVEFSLVPDDPAHGLIAHAPAELVAEQSYGCGCFWFRRPSA